MIKFGSLPIKFTARSSYLYVGGLLLYSILSVTMRHLDLVSRWFRLVGHGILLLFSWFFGVFQKPIVICAKIVAG